MCGGTVLFGSLESKGPDVWVEPGNITFLVLSAFRKVIFVFWGRLFPVAGRLVRYNPIEQPMGIVLSI